MLPPLPRCSRWASSSLVSPNRVSLPRFHVRIGLHIVLFEVCSAFTRVAACTLARSPYVVTAIRRLQTLRLLHVCSGRFRLERSPGGACTHWKSAALSRRTWEAVIRSPSLGWPRGVPPGRDIQPVSHKRPVILFRGSADLGQDAPAMAPQKRFCRLYRSRPPAAAGSCLHSRLSATALHLSRHLRRKARRRCSISSGETA